jgi:hypothetical protein
MGECFDQPVGEHLEEDIRLVVLVEVGLAAGLLEPVVEQVAHPQEIEADLDRTVGLVVEVELEQEEGMGHFGKVCIHLLQLGPLRGLQLRRVQKLGRDCVGGDCGLNDARLISGHNRSVFIVDGLCDWNLYMGSIGDSSGSSHGISMGMMTSRGWGCDASRCQKWEEDQLIHF